MPTSTDGTTYKNYTTGGVTSSNSNAGAPLVKDMDVVPVAPEAPVLSLDTFPAGQHNSLKINFDMPGGASTGGEPLKDITIEWSDGYTQEEIDAAGFEPDFSNTQTLTYGSSDWNQGYILKSGGTYGDAGAIVDGYTYFARAMVKNDTTQNTIWSKYSTVVSGQVAKDIPLISAGVVTVKWGTSLDAALASGNVADAIHSIVAASDGTTDLWNGGGTNADGVLSWQDGSYVPKWTDKPSGVFMLKYTITDPTLANSYNIGTAGVNITFDVSIDWTKLEAEMATITSAVPNIANLSAADGASENYGKYLGSGASWDDSAWPNLINTMQKATTWDNGKNSADYQPPNISQFDVDALTSALTAAWNAMAPNHPVVDANDVPQSGDITINADNAGQSVPIEWRGDYSSAVAAGKLIIGGTTYTFTGGTPSNTTGSGITDVPQAIAINDPATGVQIATITPGSAVVTLTSGFADGLPDKTDIPVTLYFSDVVNQNQTGVATLKVDHEGHNPGWGIAQTGDSLPLLPIGIASLLVAAGICALIIRRRIMRGRVAAWAHSK
jgi:hypothetical protein